MKAKLYEGKHRGVLNDWVGIIVSYVAAFLIVAALIAFFWVLTYGSASAQTAGLPSRTLIGTTPEAVQAETIERCMTMGWALEHSNPNQTVCSHEAGAFQNAMNTTNYGQGREPRWFYVVTAAQIPGTPTQTRVTIDLYFQAYTFTGSEGRRAPMSRDSRRQAENALRSLAERLCTQSCP